MENSLVVQIKCMFTGWKGEEFNSICHLSKAVNGGNFLCTTLAEQYFAITHLWLHR